jgi:hypothetical protein
MGEKWLAKISRDTILFAAGLSGIVYETLRAGAERPSLLMIFGGMMGLPVFLRKDEKKAKAEAEE